jgi:CubicO group peptidase (beta-lactamase class C family)
VRITAAPPTSRCLIDGRRPVNTREPAFFSAAATNISWTARRIGHRARCHLTGGRDLTQMAIGAFSETAYEGVGFGLGFAMTLDEVSAGSIAAGDYYWGGAASTIFWVDPKEDLIAIFMTQLIPSATFNFRGQLKNIVYSAIVD